MSVPFPMHSISLCMHIVLLSMIVWVEVTAEVIHSWVNN